MTTLREIAERDQAEAREREFDRKALVWVRGFLLVMALVSAYCILAVLGLVPAAPWSPIGKLQ